MSFELDTNQLKLLTVKEKTLNVLKIKNETSGHECYFVINKPINIVQKAQRNMINMGNMVMYSPAIYEYDDIEVVLNNNSITGWRPVKKLLMEYNKNKKFDWVQFIQRIQPTGIDKFSMEYYILNEHSEIRTKIKFINPYINTTRLNMFLKFSFTFCINGFELC